MILLLLHRIMKNIGPYKVKPFTKYRQNIALITQEGWRKRCVHALLEFDVTKARKIIRENEEKTGEKISFTGWIVKCIAEAISKHKEFNTHRQGRKRIVVFDDVDVSIPVERKTDDDIRPMVYMIRKANEKSIKEISDEIRSVQKEEVYENSQVLGKEFTRLERFVINGPLFIKKLLLWIIRRRAFLKKNYMGTTSVSAIGMKGEFPGWAIPMGGPLTSLFVVGGISKKPKLINDEIEAREYVHLTITVDHDLIDGGPLVRFVTTLEELLESAFQLSE